MNKKIIKITLIFIFAASIAYCENDETLSVFIVPFGNNGNIPPEVEMSAQELNDIVRQEVVGSKKYRYVSSNDLIKNWFNGKMEPVGGLILSVTCHAEKEMALIREKQKSYHVDLMIGIVVTKEGESLKLESLIIGIDNSKFFSLTEKCRPGELKTAVGRHVSLLLKKAGAVLKVDADRETDSVNSTVSYDIPTLDERVVELKANYGVSRPDPPLLNAQFILPEASAKASLYKISTNEGKEIEIKGYHDKGQLTDVSVITAPPSEKKGVTTERLSVTSRGGYIIYFNFQWSGKKLENVWVEPAINPYCQISE